MPSPSFFGRGSALWHRRPKPLLPDNNKFGGSMIQDRRTVLKTACLGAPLVMAGMGARAAAAAPGAPATSLAVVGNAFHINGQPTYPGRSFRGNKIEGLLFTSRMVNCIINDQNPETRGMWSYRNGPWDPERNTSE